MRDPQVVAKVENVLRSATSADEVISGLNEIAASKVAEKIIEQIADGFRSQLDEQSDDEHRFVEQVLDVDVKNGETKTVAIDCPLILTPDDPPEKKRPLKACFACGNLVSGPHTAEHKLICVYYRSTPLPEVP
jgi:hypothetical protein